MIIAIETSYRGYRFRSRLEARWAVFFTASCIDWEYEKQGYVVEGRPYLPDFWLPGLGVFFEVKGPDEYDERLMQRLAERSWHPVCVAVGSIPEPGEYQASIRAFLPPAYAHDRIDCMLDAGEIHNAFMQCSNCGVIRLRSESYFSGKGYCSCSERGRMEPVDGSLTAARSARFEHRRSELTK